MKNRFYRKFHCAKCWQGHCQGVGPSVGGAGVVQWVGGWLAEWLAARLGCYIS